MTDARDIVERDHIKETTETLFRIAINATMPKENEAKWCQALQYAGAMLEKQQADLASLRKQLEDARSLPTDDGWEDIATAPRDGTAVLVYFSKLQWHDMEGNTVSFGELRDHVERFETGWFQDGRWFESGTAHDMFECWLEPEQEPTHWRPLPAPPAC